MAPNWPFLWIFEDFWDPLELQFGLQVAQVRAPNHCSKKSGFLVLRRQGATGPGEDLTGTVRSHVLTRLAAGSAWRGVS